MTRELSLKFNNGSTLTFHARSKILYDLAAQIKNGCDVSNISLNQKETINVFVGIHEFQKFPFDTEATNIGIQTEHYFDFNGRPMWMAKNASKLINGLINLDVILDLSEANNYLYKTLFSYIRKPKITFGPYIFPSEEILENSTNNKNYIFVGSLNDRRTRILKELNGITITTDSHSEKLKAIIDQSAGVINVHYSDGIYTEWPRLLLAYLSGKAVISEQLGCDIIANKHYQLLTPGQKPHQNNKTIYTNFSKFVVPRFSFENFLKKTLTEKIPPTKFKTTLNALQPVLRLCLKTKTRKFK